MTFNPFETLGLPTRPDLDDEQVRAAWRAIAAATHPDRADGGDPAWYAQASAAYAQLNSPWGRSEAYADMIDAQNGGTIPLPVLHPRPGPGPAAPTGRCGCSPRASSTAGRCACSSAPPSPPRCPWSCWR